LEITMPPVIDSTPAITPAFRLAFRPFFLGAALFSILAIGWWSWWWLSPSSWMPYGGVLWWHAHEMLFGFACAVIAGFLLTAVQNWTGIPGLKGRALMALFGLWLLGRLSISAPIEIAPFIIATIDSSFLITVACCMAYPVIAAKRWRNLMFVPLLLSLAGLNITSHLSIQRDPELALRAVQTSIFLICLIVAIIAGRVVPMFTTNGLASAGITIAKPEPNRSLEVVSLLSLLLVVLAHLYGFEQLSPPLLLGLLALATASNTLRFVRWQFWRCLSVPLLWSLHLAYAFLPIGLGALFLQQLGLQRLGLQPLKLLSNPSAVLHCFTVGVIGSVILTMIARVSLGHTGQPLKPHRLMSAAFVCILFAALLRFIIPSLWPSQAHIGIGLAGAGWVLAYGIFCYCYSGLLTTARADGKPG